MLRVIFLGSPEPAIYPLKALLDNSGIDVAAVVSQPGKPAGRGRLPLDPPVVSFAKERHLTVLQPNSARDSVFLDSLGQLQPDFCVTAAYGQILTERFLSIPKFATLNVHPSLLPQLRGATPVQSALLEGLADTGVTILETVRKMDAGPIVVQKSFSIGPEESAGQLLTRLFVESGPLLIHGLKLRSDPQFRSVPQDENLVSHCRKLSKSDGAIDWTRPGQEIFNRFRAFHPWPGSFTEVAGNRVVIEDLRKASSPLPINHMVKEPTPGKLSFDRSANVLRVTSGDDQDLEVLRVRPSGKPTRTAAEFWNELKSKRIDAFAAKCQNL